MTALSHFAKVTLNHTHLHIKVSDSDVQMFIRNARKLDFAKEFLLGDVVIVSAGIEMSFPCFTLYSAVETQFHKVRQWTIMLLRPIMKQCFYLCQIEKQGYCCYGHCIVCINVIVIVPLDYVVTLTLIVIFTYTHKQ